MRNNSVLGVIGGIMIAVTVFLSGNTITFDSEAWSDTTALVLLAAGIAVIIFSLAGNRVATGYAAMVAGTIALIQVVDLIRDSNLDFSARLIVLVVGVILAFAASFSRRRGASA
jgi:cytochrome c oxidase subunit IV